MGPIAQVCICHINIYTVPSLIQDDWLNHGDVGDVSTHSEANTSSRICSHSNDSDSTKPGLRSWIRWQGKNSHNERPMSQKLGSTLDTLHEKISTQARIADKPSEASDLTEHDELKGEVERMRKVYMCILGA